MLFRRKHKTPIEIIEDDAKELKKEYRRFQRFRDENSLLMGVFLLGLVALVVINTLFWVDQLDRQHQRDTALQQNTLTTRVVKSLELNQNQAVKAEVKNVTTNSDADPAFALPEDQTMLIAELTLTNRTTSTQQLIPVTQLFVRTREGDTYALRATTKIKTPLEAQDLAPGASATGQISIAIPKRLDSPLLYIDTGWDRSTPLVVDVLH